MILRRLADAIRTQNWFTVIIEILIVVIGIFLGLQVTEWNEAREDRILTREYLVRLHTEVEDLLNNNNAVIANGGIGTVENEVSRFECLKEAGDFFAGNPKAIAMTARHCRSLYRSHIYFSDPLPMPTIDEMLATGRILLIKDTVLKTQLIQFNQTRAESALLMDNIRNDRLVLSRAHPALIELSPTDIFGDEARCNFEAMRENRAFINDFTDNLSRYRAYAELILEAQQQLVHDLHASIDTALNLNHN